MSLEEYKSRRYFALSHINQVRMMVREFRYSTSEGNHIIKRVQRDMTFLRAKFFK